MTTAKCILVELLVRATFEEEILLVKISELRMLKKLK